MRFAGLVLSVCLILGSARYTLANHADVFNELQSLLRAKREVLGEGSYECYSNGECVMEYKSGDLVTYREEPLCARSEQGCGVSTMERRRRGAECATMSEEL